VKDRTSTRGEISRIYKKYRENYICKFNMSFDTYFLKGRMTFKRKEKKKDVFVEQIFAIMRLFY
jgi:hypothetical protein